MFLGQYEKLLPIINPENTVIVATEPIVLMGLKLRLRWNHVYMLEAFL